MIPFLRLVLMAFLVVFSTSACLEEDPYVQQRTEEERRYLESRLEAMEEEIKEGLVNLPAERILQIIGPEVTARATRTVQADVRRTLKEELRAELTVELAQRCDEQCLAGVLDARRIDRAEAEAGRNKAIEEIRKLREDLGAREAALGKALKVLEAKRAELVAQGNAAVPVSCSAAGDRAFQEGLYGDALSHYRAALKASGPPECHRVLARVYGALGYRKNVAKHLLDYQHLMSDALRPQQVAMLRAEIRGATR